MIFHLSLILVTFILYLIFNSFKRLSKNRSDELFLKVIFILFFILVASREMTIGNDTQMYLNLFEKCAQLKWNAVSFDGYFEGGYLILNVLISYISSNKRFFMVVMSAIFNIICYFFIKKNSKDYLLSTIMYVCSLYLYTSMTMMRQYLALMIILSSFKFIKEKKLIKYLLSVAFASLFHSSVWLTLLFYPIYHMKYTKKRVFIIIIVSIIATLNIGPVINFIYSIIGRTNYYTSRIGSDSLANTLYTIVSLVMYIFAIYEIRKKAKNKETDDNNDFYLYILLFATCTNLIATNMNVLSRAVTYFSFLSIIALPNIIKNNIVEKNNLKICYLIIYSVFILYSCTIIHFRPEWNSAYNYKSCIIHRSNYICE